jgi:hypothetical protein
MRLPRWHLGPGTHDFRTTFDVRTPLGGIPPTGLHVPRYGINGASPSRLHFFLTVARGARATVAELRRSCQTPARNDDVPFLAPRLLDRGCRVSVFGVYARDQAAERAADLLADLWGLFR